MMRASVQPILPLYRPQDIPRETDAHARKYRTVAEPTVNLAEAHNQTTVPRGALAFIPRQLFVKPMAIKGSNHGT